MGSFIPKRPDIIDKLKHDFQEADKQIDRIIGAKMEAIVDVVFRTATARRPKISAAQQKAMGRNAGYRVSDPDAAVGVPVKTGDLQISIHKEIVKKGEKFTGRIFVKGPGEEYAGFMEFGTSRIRPRSFLRSAIHVNQDWIRRKFEEKPKS